MAEELTKKEIANSIQDLSGGKKKQADIIVELMLENSFLFHDQYKEPYARIKINNHYEIHSLKDKFCKRFISKIFYESEETVPNTATVTSALKVLEAKAVFDGPRYVLNNRVAFYEDSIYYDLTDENHRVVKINKEGWDIIDNAPILFKRYTHQEAQVEPLKEGDFNNFDKFTTLSDKEELILLKTQLITEFIPDIPHTVPIFYGPQGSTKSTTFKVMRTLIDPSILGVISFPKEEKECLQKANHNWCFYLDNCTTIPQWLSDFLCRLVTGDGFSKRELYTDDDDIIYTHKRCPGINGINIPVTAPDLLDRSILYKFERVPNEKRMAEKEFWKRFNEEKGKILGGIFNTLSKAMLIKENIKIDKLPRMADFAVWGEAIAQALGYEKSEFIEAYYNNIGFQNQEMIEEHPLGLVLIEFLSELKVGDILEYNPGSLLEQLEQTAIRLKINTQAREFPKATNTLVRRLNQLKTNLEDIGVRVTIGRKSGKNTSTITFEILSRLKEPPQSPQSPQIEGGKGDSGGISP